MTVVPVLGTSIPVIIDPSVPPLTAVRFGFLSVMLDNQLRVKVVLLVAASYAPPVAGE